MTKEEIQKRIEEAKRILDERKKNRIPALIEYLENMKPFKNEDDITEPPVLEKELYDKHVIPNFVRCGAIPTEKLIKGKAYLGHCRNANKAIWLGNEFEYMRTKFGCTYPERIKNFDSEDGYVGTDVFVPIKEL